MILGVTTTSVARPKILRKTYQSFFDNLGGIKFKKCILYLNIDPIQKENIEKTIAIAKSFFNNVIVNVPEKPNFSAAVKWCWKTAKEPIILHLEDDWILKEKIDFNKILELSKNAKQVILRGRPKSYDAYDKICLSPSFILYDLYKHIADKIDISVNPEWQTRDEKRFPELQNKNIYKTYSSKVIVEDIGRTWIKKSNFKKPKKKSRFINWEKKKR